MKKVLIITYYWPPSGGAGVQRWYKFARYLSQYGWQPVVLTVKPEDASYPAIDTSFDKDPPEDVTVHRTASREAFRIYKSIYNPDKIPSAGFASEDRAGVRQKIVRFIRGNFFIPDPRKGWNRYAYKEAVRIIAENRDIGCIITTSPPHSTQLIGLRLQKKYSIPWVADLRDPWTDIYYYRQFHMVFPANRINLRYEERVIRNAGLVTTVGPSLKALLLQKYRIEENRIAVVTNGFDEEDFKGSPSSVEKGFTITYTGTLSDQYTLDTFIEVVNEQLQDHPDLTLRFVGSVSGNQRRKLEQLPSEHVEFIGQVDHAKAIEYMLRSHALLLVIPEHSSGKVIVTGKLFEYLASRKPILGIGPPDGDAAQIISETGQGRMVDYRDKNSIKEALQNCMKRAEEQPAGPPEPSILRYSRKNLAGELARHLDRLVE